MQENTLKHILKSIQATHKTATITPIRRWLNSYIVTVSYPHTGDVVKFDFYDHNFLHGDSPIGMLADTICSLPWRQQVPLVGILTDILEREARHAKVTEQLSLSLQDLKLVMLSLRHDAEASKRERDAVLKKYES